MEDKIKANIIFDVKGEILDKWKSYVENGLDVYMSECNCGSSCNKIEVKCDDNEISNRVDSIENNISALVATVDEMRKDQNKLFRAIPSIRISINIIVKQFNAILETLSKLQ